MIVQRWNPISKQYYPYTIPDGVNICAYSEDMDKQVNCARCFKVSVYGDLYTSKQIHTSMGFGYGVCEDCYEKECAEERRDD